MVANCQAAGLAACKREGLPKDKLHVVYNGIEMGSPEYPERLESRHRGRIGIVANLRPIKRIADALSAFALIADKHPDAELVVIGGGDPTPLRILAVQLGIEARVQFTGQLSNPSAWIETFSIGVLCSESEGLSNAILEYMRAGVPVVATNVGGNSELVVDGETGALVPVGDTHALAAAFEKLLGDADLAKRWGEAGRDRARRQFSVEAMVESHLSLYRALIGSAQSVLSSAEAEAQ